MFTTHNLRLAAIGALLAIGAACSDDPSGPRLPAAGKFRLSLAGDFAATHAGDAIFGVDGEQGSPFFGVLLGTDEQDLANLVILRSGATRLEVGRHTIANTSDQLPDPANAVEILLGVGNASSSTVGFFDGKSGTVTITRSSADILAGTFDLVAQGLLEENGGGAEPATVRVSGAFTAEPVAGTQGARMRVQSIRLQRLAR